MKIRNAFAQTVTKKLNPLMETRDFKFGYSSALLTAQSHGRLLEQWGCVVVYTEYLDGETWRRADSVGMCVYNRPLDPFDNDYVIDLMRSAIDKVAQCGDH